MFHYALYDLVVERHLGVPSSQFMLPLAWSVNNSPSENWLACHFKESDFFDYTDDWSFDGAMDCSVFPVTCISYLFSDFVEIEFVNIVGFFFYKWIFEHFFLSTFVWRPYHRSILLSLGCLHKISAVAWYISMSQLSKWLLIQKWGHWWASHCADHLH